MREIIVRLGTWGWTVEAAAQMEYFQTGAQAERRARDLARQLADGGYAVTLKVHDMQGLPVAFLDYAPRRSEAA